MSGRWDAADTEYLNTPLLLDFKLYHSPSIQIPFWKTSRVIHTREGLFRLALGEKSKLPPEDSSPLYLAITNGNQALTHHRTLLRPAETYLYPGEVHLGEPLSLQANRDIPSQVSQARRQKIPEIKIITGSARNGEVLPLPDGYTLEECTLFVSAKKVQDHTQISGKQFCYIDSDGRTLRIYFQRAYPEEIMGAGEANYIVIGIHEKEPLP